MRNVEIKASVENIDLVEKKAKELSHSECTVIKQHDIFFIVPQGRLKLRKFPDGTGELIYYERPNTAGPKLSSYKKTLLYPETCREIEDLLSQSNGILGEVKKTRHLYHVGQTRIHIDYVNGLGNFMELEVVLKDNQDLIYGQKISENLMKDLNVPEKNLISGAYLDLILAKKASLN